MIVNYVDGISNVASISGNVRMDLFRYELDKDAEGGKKPQDVEQLIMSHEGFLDSYKKMTVIFNALANKGVYKVKPADDAEESEEKKEDKKEDKKEKKA
ncbi:hypothetical protein PQO03_14975 [Lentisphaera profundi]|uniref:Uncharacterized protein n=1 Tax=Lentisphaera profundi TaxID=1658616 RepID=A0ABY7VYZ9_9BACT|nr:hypothetical protein [Lentisphaera profundi]WDE99136.1 hypothetical protein PQO03_14975 [Lentisphaera profundi]